MKKPKNIVADRCRAQEAGRIIGALTGMLRTPDLDREEAVLRAYVAAGGSKPIKSAFDRYLIAGETYSLAEIETQTKRLHARLKK
jgi:hypothetical protein